MRLIVKFPMLPLTALFLLFLALNAHATTYYVNANGANPTLPYNSWSTAATNIQDAALYAGSGTTILVTNGVYQYSGLSNYAGSNRVCLIENSVTIQSVNGPAVTTIVGYQVPGTTNGSDAVGCVFLTSGSTLSGFTLTNGATETPGDGGGVYCASTNCLVTNCIITGNVAYDFGGGAYSGTLVNCILTGNSAVGPNLGAGGGAYGSTLINCLLTYNYAGYIGGATYDDALINCTVVSNNVNPIANSGVVAESLVQNSIIYYNSNYYVGTSFFTNCCVFPAVSIGGNNFTNPPMFVNLTNGDFQLSDGSPCINTGNNAFVTVSNDLAGNPRIIHGTVDLGAYESPYDILSHHYVSSVSTNPVPPFNDWSIAATNIQAAVDVATNGDLVLVTNGVYQPIGRPAPDTILTCVICTNAETIQSVNGSGATTINGSGTNRCVYLGNGVVFSGFTVTDGNVSSTYSTCGGVYCHSNALVENCSINNNSGYTAGGLYFGTASNCVISGNYATSQAGGAQQSVLIDCTVSGNSSGYISDLNAVGQAGGVFDCTLTNCVLTGNSSLGGYGGGALSSTLNNCTLYNNSAWVGAGADNSVLYNCLVFSNTASTTYFGYSALTAGGGLANGWAYNCIILGNEVQLDERSTAAAAWGGGTYFTTLYNCTVVDNYVAGGFGGGAYGASAYNSIIYNNTAVYNVSLVGAGNVTNVNLNNCCTFPTPSSGYFNFTNLPLFVSISGTGGNLHLQSNSPCINAGNNAYVTSTTDLDGNPRIVGGTVDVGAYEYQTPKSAISYAYLEQYGLTNDGSVDDVDLDGTGFDVYQDWIAGLNPTNPASILAMLPPPTTNNASGITVSWQSVGGISYNLLRSTNLTVQPAFSIIQTNITGQAGTTSYTDTTATNNTPYFYRVAVP